MKTFFYTIEWPNGRKLSALVEASNAQDAFVEVSYRAEGMTQPAYYGGGIVQVAGRVVAFNKVDD